MLNLKFRILLSLTAITMLISVFLMNYKNSTNTLQAETKPISTPTEVTKVVKENTHNELIKGLWVTYMDLDTSGTDRSFSSFKKKFDTILKTAKSKGFNTLIVQVRPFSDALYKSDYFPFSHIISGEQGKYSGYDPLEYMCSQCHKNNMEIHAWINPYRISTNNTPNELSKDNPYVMDKSLGVETEDGIYYNPALENVRNLIVNGIKEIVSNYDVDGIQFDDYFYPTKNRSFDSKEYKLYISSHKNNPMSLSEWRKDNVNKLIKATYKAIHSINDNVDFGISPQGNIKNNYEIYADVKTWCSKDKYIDYICPQLYYSLDNPALPFEYAIDSWNKILNNKNVKLYVGLAGYKAGSESDSGTWLDFDDILLKEYNIALKKKAKGIMLYSYNSLTEKSAKKEIDNLCSKLQ